MDEGTLEIECHICGHVGLEDGSDGFYYCQNCGSQANNIRDIGEDVDDFVDLGNPSAFMSNRRRRTAVPEPLSQSQPQTSQFWESLQQEVNEQQNNIINNNNNNIRTDYNDVDDVGPTGPMDFGLSNGELSYSDYYSQIRMRYVMGVQVLIQLQCKALVEEFCVNERVVDMATNIWWWFIARSGIFAEDWADEAITQSESQSQGPLDGFVSSGNHRDEPHNLLGQRAVMIWYRSLSKTIPLSHSLVISFLACHVLREAVLPTDILKWIIEGKLPYFAAFADIEKEIDPPPKGCPISSSRMFRPTQALSSQKLESTAAIIAETVGLELPPVNFFAIASRYLRLMSLSVDKILPHACNIYEWSMPPECRLSANAVRLPTRACVMSVLIVSIRILYNLHGFGIWEANFCGSSSLSTVCGKTELDSESDADFNDVAMHQSASPDFDAKELLLTLDTRYWDLHDAFEYLKGMPTYLQYYKDVVFAGVEPSFEDIEERKIIEEFWSKYQRRVGLNLSPDHGERSSGHNGGDNKRPREDSRGTPVSSKKLKDDGVNSSTLEQSGESHSNKSQSYINQDSSSSGSPNSSSSKHSCNELDREEALNRLKSNMEENRFCYIPPRDKGNYMNYLHYARKKDEGAYTYVAHADYYILLRACARVAQIDIRCLHAGVLGLERRLAWIEKNIDRCLNVKLPTDTCEFCRDDEVEVNANDEVEVDATDRVEVNATGKLEVNATDDPVMGFSDLNL